MKELDKKNPFNTPGGYFEDFFGNLKKGLAEKASGMPKNEGFIVPDAYFEGLHENIRQRLETEETKVISLHPYKKYYFAAASIAAVFFLVFLLNRSTSEEITFEDIANSDIENYFEDNDLEFSTYEMAEIIPIDELEIGDILSNRFDDDTILEYFDNNSDNLEGINSDYDE